MLTDADRRTLTNVQRLVRSLGDTPLAANFDYLVGRLGGSSLRFDRAAFGRYLDRIAPRPDPTDDERWIAMLQSRVSIAKGPEPVERIPEPASFAYCDEDGG